MTIIVRLIIIVSYSFMGKYARKYARLRTFIVLKNKTKYETKKPFSGAMGSGLEEVRPEARSSVGETTHEKK